MTPEAGTPQFSGGEGGRHVQFYRRPEPKAGEPVYVVVQGFHYEPELGKAIVASPGQRTGDAAIVERFRHCFRPLAGDVA